MFPSITPEMFAGSPIEAEYQRLAPNPGDFPKLVEKLKDARHDALRVARGDIRASPRRP